MRDPISIRSLITVISGLPIDPPVVNPKKWYLTQKRHWIRWLSEYHTPGAYGRQTRVKRDAKFAYNHAVQPEMLLYLASAAGVDPSRVTAANRAFKKGKTLMQKSGAIRAIIPWAVIAVALWPKYAPAPRSSRTAPVSR